MTRLRAGEIVGCGDWARSSGSSSECLITSDRFCGGHLRAIVPFVDGAITWAPAVMRSPSLRGCKPSSRRADDARLQALAVDSSGVAWAGSAQARMLRRTSGSWVRMSAELGLASSVVALWAAPRTVRAICDDGAVVEGTVSDTSSTAEADVDPAARAARRRRRRMSRFLRLLLR